VIQAGWPEDLVHRTYAIYEKEPRSCQWLRRRLLHPPSRFRARRSKTTWGNPDVDEAAEAAASGQTPLLRGSRKPEKVLKALIESFMTSVAVV
jgi:hypothetical protein